MIRENGEKWAYDAVSVFALILIDAMKTGELGQTIDRAAISVVMASWLHDHIYRGFDAKDFLKCDLEYTMTHDGIVFYTKIPAEANVSHI